MTLFSSTLRAIYLSSLFFLFLSFTFFVTAQNNVNNAKALAQDDDTDLETLPFCPPLGLDHGSRNSNVLIVSTLDGKITAIDPTRDKDSLQNVILWQVATEPGDMISSTISQMELTNNAKWVKLIPSLAGGLYKFDGETIEAVPLTAETLLKTSFKFADNTIITGGKESRTYGIEMDTGKVRYECSIDGCQNFFGDDNMDDVLVVQRETQTVRAVEPRTGQEKWNFSVSQHHVEFNAGASDLCRRTNMEENSGIQFKAVVSDGIICSVDKKNPDVIIWKHQFGAPIVHAWQINGDRLVKVDLFSSSHIPKRDEEGSKDPHPPLLYIGSHNKQIYIQENSNLADKRHPLSAEILGSDDTFPRVTWRPYLISADSRTPIYNHGARPDHPRLPLLSYDNQVAENTALAVISGSDYPFDSGLYLYPDEPDLGFDPVLDYDKTENSEIKNEGSDEEIGHELPTQSIQIVFVSLWYWWKEVVVISLLTAVMMNWMISKPIINEMKANFRRRLALAYENIQRTREVVVVEIPVPVEKPSTGTPETSGSSLKEYVWSKSQDGLFESRYLSDFEPVQCLGKGGFGVVFESKNKIDDIHYAVKRIKLPEIEDEKKKVMREVKFLAKLDHKNIVRYFNTWLEKPPPGWQEEKDYWWKQHLDGQSTRTGLSPEPFSQTDFATSGSPGSVDYTNSRPDQDSLRFNKADDSFSIVFENSGGKADSDEDSSKHSDGGLSSSSKSLVVVQPKSDIGSDSSSSSSMGISQGKDNSVTSECDDALEWEEKQQKKNHQDQKSREHVYLYIVMQLCQKESLRDWLRNCTVERSRQKSLHMFHEICLGVEYVHSQGLMHRDLKPSNIFFSSDGTVKIGDFGLVTGQRASDFEEVNKICDNHLKFPNADIVRDAQHTDQVGTELYMSPEQLKRRPYDHKVDIYSLGIILFELLVPFSTHMERVLTLSDLRKLKFPDHFVQEEEFPLVKSMLSHQPNMRPETSDVLGMDFMQTIEEEILNETSIGDNHSIVTGRRKRKSTSGSCPGESGP